MRAPSRLGQYMINGEAHELPAFVGMAILAAALRAFTHDTPCRGGSRHAGASTVLSAAGQAIEPT